MTKTVHIIVGPAVHGVCRHGLLIAEALQHETVPIERPEDFDHASVSNADVVHIPYTDRLFAEKAEKSADAFEALVQPLLSAGINVSVTLHDLPNDDSALSVRRRGAYKRVVACARGVVVNSRRELELLDTLDDKARSRCRIPLPVITGPSERVPRDTNVVVLGFVYPDRGYEHTISELPAGTALLALGGPATGHDDLPGQLQAEAARKERVFESTGFLAEADMPDALAKAGVPVAPNRRVAASASIASWVGHGRRPLVPISPYTKELAAEWPGTVTLYDADVPGQLCSAIEAALADPSLTYIEAGVTPGPTVADVAAQYARHFEATAPARPVRVGAAQWTVPDNRWDLLTGMQPQDTPSVTVVLPYFENQVGLDRVLHALQQQTHPSARLQVVVADDGSEHAPDLDAAGAMNALVVRQDNRGFRAAAARNLGASVADGEVLLFLDGDTAPEPEYVERMARLPALAPDALVVGRRRHADYRSDPPAELQEPEWLATGYRNSADLLHVDERSYRFFISAVMGMHRDLLDEIGGFDEQFDTYGGEDWDLAHRAYVAGALLAHVPDAVAWHDGPDWGARAERASKETETLLLQRLLPDPQTRDARRSFTFPALAISMRSGDLDAVRATVRSTVDASIDCAFWIEDPTVVDALDDPRVRSGPVPSEVKARALAIADLVPADLSDLTALFTEAMSVGHLEVPAGTLTASRTINRSTRWALRLGSPTPLFGQRDLARPIPFD